jgi:hypothetical protein
MPLNWADTGAEHARTPSNVVRLLRPPDQVTFAGRSAPSGRRRLFV